MLGLIDEAFKMCEASWAEAMRAGGLFRPYLGQVNRLEPFDCSCQAFRWQDPGCEAEFATDLAIAVAEVSVSPMGMCGDAGRITLCKCTPRVPIFFDIDAHDHPGAEEADAGQEVRQNMSGFTGEHVHGQRVSLTATSPPYPGM